ncbi:FtsH protease activity modulator HflK [Alkalitalea saponilacus]|uniref:Protein HflK n=1 Tax=Alkalitalea saponilacus TaxID=889453 RepID=A0A1T5HKP9_9BACT|nr:FtsH protease activity modulator HflK [Alkalitalea saponilacus]ASB47768.1 HflK protein [Alkalitalea saponilacus]SKC21121.1 membrane protease subunit HflK [Alkalitalea saponilacus]
MNQHSEFDVPPFVKDIFGNIPRLAGIVLLAVLAWNMIFQIASEEVGVITRFGKFERLVSPGLNFKMPFVEKLVKVPVERQQKQEFGFRTVSSDVRSEYTKRGTSDESLMLTGDLNLADVEWVVQYRIQDPFNYLFMVRNPESTLRDISESSMRQIVGDRTVNEVLTVGRTEVAHTVRDLIQGLVDEYSLGLRIEQVVLQDVNPPDPVKPAFNAVNQAQQERETLINQAKAEYNRVIPRARGQAQETIQRAEGYATARVNNAQGESARFNLLFDEYMRAPEITKRRIYLETMQRVIPQMGNKIITDQDGNNVIPLLQMQLSQGQKKESN